MNGYTYLNVYIHRCLFFVPKSFETLKTILCGITASCIMQLLYLAIFFKVLNSKSGEVATKIWTQGKALSALSSYFYLPAIKV